MSKKFLRDEVSTIILTDYELRDYVVSIISKATGLDYDFVHNNLELDSNRVNNNINTKYSEVDAIYQNNNIYINIEVNTSKSILTEKKNFRYICNLILRQVPPSKKDKFKNIYQININDYDIFNKNKFVYESIIMEKELHEKRSDFLTIIDINLEYLRKLDYNEIKKEEANSLEKLLYIFVCEDNKKREKLYSDDNLMDKVNEKLENLTEEFGSLYYDKEQYRKDVIYELGETDGAKNKAKEIAKKMLSKGKSIEEIMEFTELSKEDIENL